MKLVLIDRDGVLNEESPAYIKSPAEWIPIPGAAEAVARLNRAGVKVAVCTNQSVVGRGIIGADQLERIHARLHDELARAGAHLDAIFTCVHHPGAGCACRKPQPGMLREALRRFGASAVETPMIGDSVRDLEAATALGCPRHLVRTGFGAKTQAEGVPAHVLPVAVHDDLAAAVNFLLNGRA
jgi:D-glycero-D-manno-heptose 1,7-bisphosphate phosphatase